MGGNAVDAAVATGFALAVCYPEAGNIGGGGFMIMRNADGSTDMIDYREKAPLQATRDMYLDSAGNVIVGSEHGYPSCFRCSGNSRRNAEYSFKIRHFAI